MSAKDIAFLLFDLPPPLGLKDDNIHNQKETDANAKTSGFMNPKRKIWYKKEQIFDALGKFNVKLYSNHKAHFKDLCIQISYKAVLMN